MNRRWLYAILLFVAVALVACAGEINLLDETKLQDTSLLSGEPCEAPCWNDIRPGETSYRDAKLILESSGRFKIGEETEAEGDDPGRAFTFAEGENATCCQLISSDGETASSLLLQLAPSMIFGPVFDKYGEPEYAAAGQVSDAQGFVALVYSDVPMVIYALVENPQEGALSVSSPIFSVLYMAEPEKERLLTCAELHYWQGFQSFAIYAAEAYDFVGDGVGDEAICPEG